MKGWHGESARHALAARGIKSKLPESAKREPVKTRKQPKPLRVWWNRNPPGPSEYFNANSPEEALKILDELADEDLNNPRVTDNAGGLVEYDEGEEDWLEWYNEEGEDIDEYGERLQKEGKIKLKHS